MNQLLMSLMLAGAVGVAETASAEDRATTAGTAMMPCQELPSGGLTDEELEKLAPENSLGRVRIAWKTESQENTYGFNILRADGEPGPYKPINKAIIPGEGTTNVPKGYCFEDNSVKRGETYYYQIEEVTTLGERNIVEGTAGTKVKVKTVQEERDWLRKKAAESAER